MTQAFPWRGLMLDCARRWWPPEVLHMVLESLAASGGNRLHLHLTDDQGWRLPLRSGELAEGGSRPDRPGLQGAGVYTRSELKELVAHANELAVEILPEVDLPGHCRALLAARPELSCDGKKRELPRAWGGYRSPLCLASPQLYPFVEELLDCLAEIFPFPMLHLGGDEVRVDSWTGCPHCRNLAAEASLAGPEALQSWWTPWISRHLEKAGLRAAFWDEAREWGAGEDALLFAWRNSGAVERCLDAGFETVACPVGPCYLDHYPGEETGQARAIMGLNSWKDALAWNPQARPGLLGGQANLWSEYMSSPARLMEHLQPRLALLLDGLKGRTLKPADLPALLRTLSHGQEAPRLETPLVSGPRVTKPGMEIELETRPVVKGMDVSVELEGDADMERVQVDDGLNLRLRRRSAGSVLLKIRSVLDGNAGSPALERLVWMDALEGCAAGSGTDSSLQLLRAACPDWQKVEAADLEHWQWPVSMEDFLACKPVEKAWSEVESYVTRSPDLPEISPWTDSKGLRLHTNLELEHEQRVELEVESMGLARLHLDKRLVLDHDGFQPANRSVIHLLLAGGSHKIRFEWLQLRREGGARLRLGRDGNESVLKLPGCDTRLAG